MTLKNKPKRNTGINCPFCMKGFIIDQRAYSVTKDTPFWICNSSLSLCTYTEKYNKKWQWASWQWETPYFILINENSDQKKERELYEEEIVFLQKEKEKNHKIEEQIISDIKYCRICGSRSCEKLNNCM